MTIRIVKKKPAKKISRKSEETDNMANDHDLIKHLTDKDLRRVFSGLSWGQNNNHQPD
jgi:hypothetical protein